MTPHEAALDYFRRGLVPVPVGVDKKPLIQWRSLMTTRPTEEQIEGWFKKNPSANIGIVTGKLSGLSVIDIDTEEGFKRLDAILPDTFTCPTVKTPRGGKHLYCKYHHGFGNNVRALEGVDLRSEGGYVVAPPSINGTGKGWEWELDLGTPVPPLPEGYIRAITENVFSAGHKSWKATAGQLLVEGRRNNDLWHILYTMAKGGERGDDLIRIAHDLGKMVGIDEAEIAQILASVNERVSRGERNLSREIADWVSGTTGVFTTKELRLELQITSEKEKNLMGVILNKMKRDAIIEAGGAKNGEYRLVVKDCEAVDWINSPTDALDIRWPLGIHEMAAIYPKSIVVVAGRSNKGKTACLIDVVKQNMNRFDIHYFSSEMGGSEARVRLAKHEDIQLHEWNFKLWDRASDFADVIKPNSINIIDYLEDLTGEEYKVKSYISKIWNKLENGVAIIALQKNQGRDFGRGGEATLDRARLYLAIDDGRVKIVKAKAWMGTENPNGLVKMFRLVQGWKFIEDSGWITEDEVKVITTPDSPPKKKKLF